MAVLDGNVARVLSRLDALPAAIRDPRGARRLWALADSLVPMRRPGDWNQAMMELGATICTPRRPRCAECPLRWTCRARRLGRIEAFPPVVGRRASETVRRAVVLIVRGDRVLMARREGALLAGLWEPPGADLANGSAAAPALRAVLSRLGARARITDTGRVVRHTITYRTITAEVWRGTPVGAMPRRANLRWVDPARAPVPLTALARKLTRHDSP